jgi:hypothetical protein
VGQVCTDNWISIKTSRRRTWYLVFVSLVTYMNYIYILIICFWLLFGIFKRVQNLPLHIWYTQLTTLYLENMYKHRHLVVCLQYKLIILFQISTIVKRNPVVMEEHVLTKWTAICVHVSKTCLTIYTFVSFVTCTYIAVHLVSTLSSVTTGRLFTFVYVW